MPLELGPGAWRLIFPPPEVKEPVPSPFWTPALGLEGAGMPEPGSRPGLYTKSPQLWLLGQPCSSPPPAPFHRPWHAMTITADLLASPGTTEAWSLQLLMSRCDFHQAPLPGAGDCSRALPQGGDGASCWPAVEEERKGEVEMEDKEKVLQPLGYKDRSIGFSSPTEAGGQGLDPPSPLLCLADPRAIGSGLPPGPDALHFASLNAGTAQSPMGACLAPQIPTQAESSLLRLSLPQVRSPKSKTKALKADEGGYMGGFPYRPDRKILVRPRASAGRVWASALEMPHPSLGPYSAVGQKAALHSCTRPGFQEARTASGKGLSPFPMPWSWLLVPTKERWV